MVGRVLAASFACSLVAACRAPDEDTIADMRGREPPQPVESVEVEPLLDHDDSDEKLLPGDLDNRARFDVGHDHDRHTFVRRADLALAQLEGELGMLDAQITAMNGRLSPTTLDRDAARDGIREAKNELERVRVAAGTETEQTRDLVARHIDDARSALAAARDQVARAQAKI
jgi:hypothetical protein